MIPAQVRIFVCIEPIDMRLYAERAVMPSRIFSACRVVGRPRLDADRSH
jgi:hypothetical protein